MNLGKTVGVYKIARMMIYNTIVLCTTTILGLYYTSISTTYARMPNDCGLVQSYVDENGNVLPSKGSWAPVFNNTQLMEVFPPEHVDIALSNLRAACCEMSAFATSDGENELAICTTGIPSTRQWPTSVYLYDHIVDIWFRSLDGIDDLRYIYPGMRVDTKAQERREFMDDKAVSIDGAIPIEIINVFGQYRYGEEGTRSLVHIDHYADFFQALETLAGEEYANMGLASRYYAACYLGLFINPRLDKQGSHRSDARDCMRVANARINQEQAYVEVTALEQGSQLLRESFSLYTTEYFTKNGMASLLEDVSNLTSLMNYLAKKTEGTRMCASG